MKKAPLVILAWALFLVSCGDDQAVDPNALVVVTPDKADNFFSPTAREYVVSGQYHVELEEEYRDMSDQDQMARVKELIGLKQVAVNWFLDQHLAGYYLHSYIHNFRALTKNGSYQDMDIEQDPNNRLRYTFRFQQEMGGEMDLIKDLATWDEGSGSYRFDIVVGKVSNQDLGQLEAGSEWYRSKPWSAFVPKDVPEEQKETLTLDIMAQAQSSDAWLDYQRLFEDGKLTIGIHFGYDPNADLHSEHSRSVYVWLVQQGFKAPVSSYDYYRRTSGALTRTIQVDGREIQVEVSLFWPTWGWDASPNDPQGGINLENDLRQSFAEREVIIYAGHTNIFSGFTLANWKVISEGYLDDTEIPGLDMPETYQVILADGCDTYALGEAFWANPAKESQDNLDVITSTNRVYVGQDKVVLGMLAALIGDAQHDVEPIKLSELLTRFDEDGSLFYTPAMYGLHGIDDNPRLHPFARVENLCKPCRVDSDCGNVGNTCLYLNSEERVCAAECIDSTGCPKGYICQDVAFGDTISSRQCVPSTYTCSKD